MKFYLKVINPAIAFIILGLCYWASSTYDEGKFSFLGLWMGGMYTYFFAKGLFTCSTLLILGKLLQNVMFKDDKKEVSPAYYLYIIGLIGIAASSFLWIYSSTIDTDKDEKNVETVTIVNPVEIKIIDSYRITESEWLKIGIKVKDESEINWKKVKFCTDLFIEERLIGDCSCTSYNFDEDKNKNLVIDCNDFRNEKINDSLRFEIKIKAEKNKNDE